MKYRHENSRVITYLYYWNSKIFWHRTFFDVHIVVTFSFCIITLLFRIQWFYLHSYIHKYLSKVQLVFRQTLLLSYFIHDGIYYMTWTSINHVWWILCIVFCVWRIGELDLNLDLNAVKVHHIQKRSFFLFFSHCVHTKFTQSLIICQVG